jgi:hypothetical protein
MSPERLRQVEELYHLAREREPASRHAFLEDTCPDDEDLRREVESLLAQDGDRVCLLDEPLGRVAAEVLDGGISAPLEGADLICR